MKLTAKITIAICSANNSLQRRTPFRCESSFQIARTLSIYFVASLSFSCSREERKENVQSPLGRRRARSRIWVSSYSKNRRYPSSLLDSFSLVPVPFRLVSSRHVSSPLARRIHTYVSLTLSTRKRACTSTPINGFRLLIDVPPIGVHLLHVVFHGNRDGHVRLLVIAGIMHRASPRGAHGASRCTDGPKDVRSFSWGPRHDAPFRFAFRNRRVRERRQILRADLEQ